MSDTVRIYLTAQECAMARELLNIALKTGGRNVVQAFAAIDGKIAQAVEAKVKKEQDASPVE